MIKLDTNEKLIAVFRKHVFYISVKIVGLVVLALLPLLFFPVLEAISEEIREGVLNNFFAFIYLVYITILWIFGFIMWMEYYLDMWLLTDKRVINVEQKGLFYREISSLRLDRIQDVKIEVIGVLDTFLHIGSVHVQTAGSEKEFMIPSAKEPNIIKEQILEAHNREVEAVKTVRIENPQS